MSVRLRSLAPVGAVVTAAAIAFNPLAALAPAAQTHASSKTTAKSGLADNLDRILSDKRLDGAMVGLEVRNAETGKVLYKKNVDQRLNPASNAKLLTSLAAMKVLGPDHRFATSVLRTGQVRGHTLHGDLYLRGGGDPTILAGDYDRLAKRVAAAGIRKVHGSLVADDTYFDDTRLGPFWSWDDEPYYYNAQISALTVAPNTDYDAGTVIVRIAPGDHEGDKAKVSVVPDNDYVHINNKATTGASGSDNTTSAVRRHGNNTIDVTGSIPAGADADRTWVTVWEPTDLVASLFRDALRSHGVRVQDDDTKHRATPERAERVADHKSMSLSAMLVPFLKLSNNMHAEHLTKTMGAEVKGEGSWDAGTDVLMSAVADFGVNTDTLRMVDGSGLSRGDLLTAHEITNLLIAAQDEPWFDTWYDALPIAGNPKRFVGGTLRSRMTDTPAADNMHAKTGSLTSVSGLSGYVTDGAGDPLVFSMLTNNYVADSGVKDIEDAVGVQLASYGAKNARHVRVQPHERRGKTYDPSIECSWAKAC
ncbi:MAG: D-alanyl-D-alanine carboxypeptidase/D-alanyl-D-alanine endopeptidase [Streptosporangiales bacterium]